MLRYTGHALYDVGVAAVTAFSGKEDPSAVTTEDCAEVASYIEKNYAVPPLSSFLAVSLMNSDFTQPAYRNAPERREAYARLVAGSFGPDVPQHPTDVCAFTGEPALGLPLSLRTEKEPLPAGRAFRQHLPLVTGEGVINFSVLGNPGVPISGKALLCFTFLPMGCYKCGGRLLAIHSDNPEILLSFASAALKENIEAVHLAQTTHQSKLRDAPRAAQTLLVERLIEIESMRRVMQRDPGSGTEKYSVTAYHLSNSGQSSPLDRRSPPLQIYQFPLEIVDFLATVMGKDYCHAWNRIAQRSWKRPRPALGPSSGTESSRKPSPHPLEGEAAPSSGTETNFLYEDLFRLPQGAVSFVRRHLLRIPSIDPSSGTETREELEQISWPLTELFLRKVIRMDEHRIEEIRQLGDRLATYVNEQEDQHFFRAFFTEQRPWAFRTLLLKANDRHIKAGHPPLITLDPYLIVFEQAEETMKADWRFARDLVYLRMVEVLATKWLPKHLDLLSDTTETDAEAMEQQ